MGARWAAFFTVSGAIACLPEAVLFLWNLLDARDTGAWLRDNWDVAPRFLASGLAIAVVITSLTLLVSSFTTRRAYAAIGLLAVLFIGAAVGGLGRENFEGTLADALSLADVMQSLRETAHWLFGGDVTGPVAGWVTALWLVVLVVVCGAWLLRRTERLVRG